MMVYNGVELLFCLLESKRELLLPRCLFALECIKLRSLCWVSKRGLGQLLVLREGRHLCSKRLRQRARGLVPRHLVLA